MPFATCQWKIHFCRIIAGQNRPCSDCLRLQEKLCRNATKAPKAVQCAYGMVEIAVPLRLGSRTIGFLRAGQALRNSPDDKAVKEMSRRLALAAPKCDLETAREMFVKTQVLSQRQAESIKRLLSIFAEHLAMKSNLMVIREANTEPLAVTRTKQFVEANYGNDISLADAARAAG